MKPQNYSVKFQNSLAESRITPGSQRGKEPVSKTPTVRNGHRAQRKLTKYQQRLAQSKAGKIHQPMKPTSLNAKSGDRALDGEQMAQAYSSQRAAEKAQEAKHAETMTGKIL
jgi:hypothetical protein